MGAQVTSDTTDTKIVTTESRSESPDNLAPEMLIKHPLQNSWTLWFFKNDKNRNWEDNQRSIITFSCHPSSALGVTTVYSRKVSSQCGRTTEIVGEVVGSSTSTKVKGRPSWTTFGWKLCFA